MDWSPSKKYKRLLSQVSEVLDKGGQRTVRDVYYALESRGYDWEYRKVKHAVKKGRRAGYLDPGQIVDASRPPETQRTEGYNDISIKKYVDNSLSSIAEQYYEDWWREQDEYVEVWVEKQSLASVFAPICRELNVRLEATRGDWSDSKVYEATKRLTNGPLDRGQDVTILYFGDYNPSGFHAPVGVQKTMKHYGIDLMRDGAKATEPEYFDIAPTGRVQLESNEGDVTSSLLFKRVALNTEHIERFDLPTNPTPSSSDKDETIREGFKSHVTNGRDINVELNALKEFHRDSLETIIRDAITDRINDDVRKRVEQRTEERRDKIRDLMTS